MDNCQFCHGAKGGVEGNENVIRGIIVCDYCTVLVRQLFVVPPRKVSKGEAYAGGALYGAVGLLVLSGIIPTLGATHVDWVGRGALTLLLAILGGGCVAVSYFLFRHKES